MKFLFARWLSVTLALCLLLSFAPTAMMEEALEPQAETVEESAVESVEEGVEETVEPQAETTEEPATESVSEGAEEETEPQAETAEEPAAESIEEQGADPDGNAEDAIEEEPEAEIMASPVDEVVEEQSVELDDEALVDQYDDVDAVNALLTGADGSVVINKTNFPDDNFRAYVAGLFNKAEGDTLSADELASVTSINVNYTQVADLSGIERFPNLETLYCSYTQLTTLDVSGCAGLEFLSCNNTQLTTLDVSGCAGLESLLCNNNQLTTLDVSGCAGLESLSCYDNQLTTLDVSGFTSMGRLYCESNQLTTLDVSGCTGLESLSCNNNQLTTLNVSGCAGLESLSCANNQLTTLDVSGCTGLESLSCYSNQLTTMDIRSCSKLVKCVKEGSRNWNYGIFIGYTYESEGYRYELKYSPYMAITFEDDAQTPGSVVINKAYFPDDNFRHNVVQLVKKGEGEAVSADELASVTKISIINLGNGSDITELTGIKLFPNLKTLHLRCNDLTTLDVSGCTNLTELWCNGNQQLTTINASGCTNLTDFTCNNNQQLTTLNVSGCTNLKNLLCAENNLTSLIIRGCTNLTSLVCYNNRLTTLDISDCPNFISVSHDENTLIVTDKTVNPTTKTISDSTQTSDPTPATDPAPAPAAVPALATVSTPVPVTPIISAVNKSSKTTLTAAPGTICMLDLGGATGKAFKSSKKKVASVDGIGIVTINGAGKTKITFKVGKKKRTVTLTVKDPTVPTSVTLVAPVTEAKKGDVVTLTPVVDAGTNPGGYKWKSSNKKVASVSADGVVTFKKAGKVTVTCTAKRGKKKAKVKFRVSK